MAKLLNIESGDYTVKVNDGNSIILATGVSSNPGKVIVTGDLEIQGATTSVSSTDLVIEDNIIQLNNVNTSDGSNYEPDQTTLLSGVEVNRGYVGSVEVAKARWLYSGDVIFTDPQNPGNLFTRGAWSPRLTTGDLSSIEAVSITSPSNTDLNLLGMDTVVESGGTYVPVPHTGAITVQGTAEADRKVGSYGNRIGPLPLTIADITGVDPIQTPSTAQEKKLDIIPNVEWVLGQISYTLTQTRQPRIQEGTFGAAETFVETQDDSVSGISQVIVGIDGIVTTTFKDTQSQFYDVVIKENKITTLLQDQDLELYGNRNGSVKINDNLLLTYTSDHLDGLPGPGDAVIDPPAPGPGQTGVKIYSKPEEPGGTGIFFVNKEFTRDELISKNKAILYSMIF